MWDEWNLIVERMVHKDIMLDVIIGSLSYHGSFEEVKYMKNCNEMMNTIQFGLMDGKSQA